MFINLPEGSWSFSSLTSNEPMHITTLLEAKANSTNRSSKKTEVGSLGAGGVGFEPTTTNLGGWCSVRTELPAQAN